MYSAASKQMPKINTVVHTTFLLQQFLNSLDMQYHLTVSCQNLKGSFSTCVNVLFSKHFGGGGYMQGTGQY